MLYNSNIIIICDADYTGISYLAGLAARGAEPRAPPGERDRRQPGFPAGTSFEQYWLIIADYNALHARKGAVLFTDRHLSRDSVFITISIICNYFIDIFLESQTRCFILLNIMYPFIVYLLSLILFSIGV